MALTEKTVDINVDSIGREQPVILSVEDIRILDQGPGDPIISCLFHPFVWPGLRLGELAVSAFPPVARQVRHEIQTAWNRQFLLHHVVMIKDAYRSAAAACCFQKKNQREMPLV